MMKRFLLLAATAALASVQAEVINQSVRTTASSMNRLCICLLP